MGMQILTPALQEYIYPYSWVCNQKRYFTVLDSPHQSNLEIVLWNKEERGEDEGKNNTKQNILTVIKKI